MNVLFPIETDVVKAVPPPPSAVTFAPQSKGAVIFWQCCVAYGATLESKLSTNAPLPESANFPRAKNGPARWIWDTTSVRRVVCALVVGQGFVPVAAGIHPVAVTVMRWGLELATAGAVAVKLPSAFPWASAGKGVFVNRVRLPPFAKTKAKSFGPSPTQSSRSATLRPAS